MFKKAMGFASFKIKEFEQFGEKVLEMESPFNEAELLARNSGLLIKD